MSENIGFMENAESCRIWATNELPLFGQFVFPSDFGNERRKAIFDEMKRQYEAYLEKQP